MIGLANLTIVEAKMVWRDPLGLVLPLGLPGLIMVMNGVGADRTGVPDFGGMPALDAFVVPLTLVMILGMIGMLNLPSFLATYRRTGVLRRLAVTPAHPAMVLTAQVLVSLVQALIGLAAALAIAFVAFDIAAPNNVVGAVAVLGLAVCALYALGMLIAAVAPTTNAAIAIGVVLFFVTMALGGGFGPAENLPTWLATIGEHAPFGAALAALSDSWAGSTPQWQHLAALGATTVVSVVAAAKLFRWD